MATLRDVEQELRTSRDAYDALFPTGPDLEQRILAHSTATTSPSPRSTWRRDLAVSTLIVLVVASLAIGIRELRGAPQPAGTRVQGSPITESSRPAPSPSFPAQDLSAAGLTDPTQVTPFNLTATSNGRTITLIGGYADPARLILFFRMTPGSAYPSNVQIDDSRGFLNAGTSGSLGIPGDDVYILETGPHPDADGLAHLTINIFSLFKLGQIEQGQWHFAIQVPVGLSIRLPAPSQFRVGTWIVTVEILEETPTVINFQAVINGTDVPGASNAVTLLDQAGRTIQQGCGAGITVPKDQQTVPVTRARVYCEYPIPKVAGTYHIRIDGGGGVYLLPVIIR
jgi:hypothetical protein